MAGGRAEPRPDREEASHSDRARGACYAPGMALAKDLPRRPTLTALLVCAAACQSTPSRAPLDQLRAAATPTLQEIFLLPGLQGRAPRIEELSADGRWVVFHFNPMAIAADGTRTIPEARSLRIQSTLAPQTTDFEGLRLEDLLPPRAKSAEEDGAKKYKEPEIALSHHGARMLALRERELFLLDPPTNPREKWTVRKLLQVDADSEIAFLKSPRFSDDDSAVLVTGADRDDPATPLSITKDLWSFPIAADASHPWPLAEADGTNLTATIDGDPGRLAFSRDLRVVFARDPAVGAVDVPATESTAASHRAAQILWRDTGKAVELEGMGEFKTVENTSLSPDGRFVLAVVPDRTKDPAPTVIPDYLSPRVSTREGRRELADDSPSPRQIYLWNTESGERSDLSLGEGDVFWQRMIGWAPQPSADTPARLALARLSEDFRTLETFLWSEASGLVQIMVDRDERWIGGPVDRARWSSDGRRLIFGSESFPASTLPGRAQLFAFDVATGSVRQLTTVSGEVNSFDLARDGGIVFSYCNANSRDRNKVAYISPDGVVRDIAAPIGFDDDPKIAADASQIVFTHARMFQPRELWSADANSNQPAYVLTHTATPEFARRDWIHPVLFEVEGERGAMVRSHVFLPRSSSLADPDRARGAVVFIHGAGYLQNVTDSMTEYEPNLMFHSRLAGMGYVVVDVDYRGSAGYGQDFRTAVQFHLGGLELKDIDATLDELARRGVIDSKRVGCYGGSYGGFLTLMALFTEGQRWSAGAALRSVTDWRTYHPGYTQPRLGRPSTHAEAYALSSPIDHAEGLNKPLLLLHGMMDSNVFAQDTIRLMEKLIDLGKDFEVMLYPSQNHAFTDGAHWLDEYKRIERFLMEHLGAP